MSENLFKVLNSKKARWTNEEELRQAWVTALHNETGIDFHAERGKKDLSYNNVVIEFKSKGLFKGKKSSRSFREAMDDRLLPYILKTAKIENRDPSNYIGIAIDGNHICFAQESNSQIEHGQLLEFSETSLAMVVTAIKDNFRRGLNGDNLIEDFGHDSICGIALMTSLSNALSLSLNDKRNNKTKMLFEEWKSLFGQVADLSAEQIFDINKKLKFTVNVSDSLKIPAALFVIHTFNSLIIKLLAAEIISAHKLTSYSYFAQSLSMESDEKLFKILNSEIEEGGIYKSANINGFVEEALFSWYLDAKEESIAMGGIITGIRDILIKLSFYRTDNLSHAQSTDLLKIFYQNIVPETLRKTLGEFYTPDWLVEFTLNKAGRINWLDNRSLDPTCGSGSFLIEIIKRKIMAGRAAKWETKKIIRHLTDSVWGFDLNPLAVQTARVNFLIYLADLLKELPGETIELPILLADAIYSPAKDPDDQEDVVRYKIGSEMADLEITLPSRLASDREKLDKVFQILGECIETNLTYHETEKLLIKRSIVTSKEMQTWRNPIESTYDQVFSLHKNKWNGIWFRIVRNFFWSSTAGKFSLVAGNPPWVRWSKLPELYRERIKPTCSRYNIFSSTPHHGGNELDISGMITYTVSDKWLETNGILAFVITQTHFQTPSSEGFRNFVINSNDRLVPLHVDDLKALRPFPDAANKTAVAVFQKVKDINPKYPVRYTVWQQRFPFPKNIPVDLSLKEVLSRLKRETLEATPVNRPNSPWAILPVGRFEKFKKIRGRSTWVQGRKGITADLNGIYFVDVIATNLSKELVQISTRPDAGKKDIGPTRSFWVEPALLFPLIKGASDFNRCYFKKNHNLFAIIPNHGINIDSYKDAKDYMDSLPKIKQYFKSYRNILENRSTLRGRMPNAPFYAIYNVGDYTFAPYKVIWAEQKDFCAAVVSEADVPLIGKRPLVPDHKLFFVDFESPNPAFFLCGLLNSDFVIEWITSHNISIQTGDIFKHMSLPPYDPTDKNHDLLVSLVRLCHDSDSHNDREKIFDKISKLSINILGVS